MSKQLSEWFRSNALTLLSIMVVAGITYGMLKAENTWRDARIAETRSLADKATERVDNHEKQIAALQIRQESVINALAVLTGEGKSTQKDVAEIKAQLGVLSTKLDNITEILKKQVNHGN